MNRAGIHQAFQLPLAMAATAARWCKACDAFKSPFLRTGLLVAMLALGGCGSGGDDGSQGGGSPPATSGPGQLVTATGGAVETADRAVKLVIPAGALDAPTSIAITHLDAGAPPAGLPATVLSLGGLTVMELYQFGPDGLNFAQPARLTIAYDPAKLPAGVTPESLVIAKLRDDGLIQLARNLQVDAANHTVSGDISGFSSYALAIDPHPPATCGYADETLNEDLQVDSFIQTSVNSTQVILSFTTTRPDPGCTGDPMVGFQLERAPASVPMQGGNTREPLDREFVPQPYGWVSLSQRSTSGRLVTFPLDVDAGQSYRFRVIGHSFKHHLWMPTSSVRVDVPSSSSSGAPPAPEHFAAAWDDPYAAEFFYTGAAHVRTPRVRLNWTPVPQADRMQILRRKSGELLYSEIDRVVGGVTTYDNNVTADGHYFYRVVAFNGAVPSSTFVEREVVPLGTSALTDPAFHICFPTNSAIQPFDCSRPHAPFPAPPGASTTIRFKVVMIPVFSNLPNVVNVPDCDIRFSLFNASGGVLPAQTSAFAPSPVHHQMRNGLLSYDVDLTLDVAATASLGVHGMTLYATGCAGTVAKQPLLVDVRPAGTQLVAVTARGAGNIRSEPSGAGQPGDIDCPATGCVAYFQYGSRPDLNASTSAVNLRFDHWEGDCSGNASRYSLQVDGDKFCTAVFATNAATAHAGVINATQYDSYARASSSLVYAWGLDSSEQLGNGPGNSPSRTPQQVSGIADAVAISRSYGSGVPLAVRAGGEVWGWGVNNSGQLGDGTTDPQALPIAMKDSKGTPVGNAVMAAGGGNHSLVLMADGSVWATGGNPGDGNLTARTHAAPVPGLAGIVSIAAGAGNSYAVKNDGTVWAWGDNTDGALGDGTTAFRSTPVQVVGLSNIVDVVAGYEFAIALDGNGDVWSWGRNASGQLGDGTTVGRVLPARIASISGVKAIAAGTEHALAIMADDTLRGWGRNTNGRLGLGDQSVRLVPTPVGSLATVVAIAAGDTHSLAMLADGTVWAWGSNAGGQLGLGTTVTQYLTPQQVPGLQLN